MGHAERVGRSLAHGVIFLKYSRLPPSENLPDLARDLVCGEELGEVDLVHFGGEPLDGDDGLDRRFGEHFLPIGRMREKE